MLTMFQVYGFYCNLSGDSNFKLMEQVCHFAASPSTTGAGVRLDSGLGLEVRI